MFAIIVLCCVQAAIPITSQPTTHLPPTKPNIDEIIDLLPHAETETGYDYAKCELIEHPIVIDMRQWILDGHQLTDAQWRKALSNSHVVFMREKWPVNEPLRICVQETRWLPFTEIRVTPKNFKKETLKVGTTGGMRCGTGAEWQREQMMNVELARLPLGNHRIDFDVEIEMGGSAWVPEARRTGVLWRGNMSFDVEIVKSLDKAVPPINNPEIKEAIRQAIGVCVSPTGQATVIFDVGAASKPLLQSIAVSARVDLCRNGQAVESIRLKVDHYRLWGDPFTIYADPPELFASERLTAISAKEFENGDLEGWTLRITGTTKDLLRFWHANQYWHGTIEIPLKEALENELNRTTRKGIQRFYPKTNATLK